MTPVSFRRYSPTGADPTVIIERITHYYLVDYNGNYGTCLVLDTGKEVIVGEWPQDVDKRVAAALAAKGSA